MLPAPVVQQAPVLAGGDAAPAAGLAPPTVAAAQPELAAVLQQLVALLTQMSGLISAQGGAALATGAPVAAMPLTGGGSASAMPVILPATGVTSLATASLPAEPMIGAGLTISSPATSALPTPVVGGGGGAAAAPVSLASASASPAPAAPAAPAATASPQVDMRRLVGTPQPGGVIDTILRSHAPTAPPAKSEGAFIVLTDGNGAQLQAHVHGAWRQHPDRILEGIQRGFIAVHVHPDGVLHLHDIV
ncbi:MAG: hypothetical protein ABI200_00285 [Gaiellales bacterium]